MKTTLEKNRATITDHGSSKSHLAVIEVFQKQSHKRIRTEFENIKQLEEKKDNNFLEVTSRMFRTVYVLNKLTMSFSSHSGLVTLQKLNGIDMGFHHYEKTSCTRMTVFISEKMHSTLIENIMKTNVPVSIIVDGTTDSRLIHYLIVYFQTIENEIPMIYFYRLLELPDETSLGHFEVITKAWKEEKGDFYGYMQNNLVGFASDGAPVNLGKNGGLVEHMKKFAKNNIISVHCMAHT